MKRLFVLFALLGACKMAGQYTPNPANDPAQIPRLDDGDPPDASSINPSIEALADKSAHLDTGNSIILASLPTTPGGIGKKVYVDLIGWYSWAVASPYATPFDVPDGFFIVAIVATGGGVWMYSGLGLHSTNRLPLIGPAPGDGAMYPTVSAAGRLNKGIIDHGYFTHDISPAPAGYVVTSTTGQTLFLSDMGTLAVGHIVKFSIAAWAHFTVYTGGGIFEVWSEYSEDGGASWHKIHPSGAAWHALSSNDYIGLTSGLEFQRAVANAGDFQVRVRAALGTSGDSLDVEVQSWLIEVIRP